ncbi:hypothetical protein ACWDUL_33500 [Nocardia niigatensis]|uniref:hypothetical protein n=1 Tax=Nocardia niigatensis TaxID=209249 RepID=UPI0005948369|nr:hypothetical protein [Nocardia niigatensis]
MTSARSNIFARPANVFADVLAAEQAALLERNALAAKTVADHAHDAADCAHLLAILGLDPSELKRDGR